MDLIPLPRMSDFLFDDFMTPLNIDAFDLAAGAHIPIDDVRAVLADELDVTPEISRKLAAFFGVSSMLFYDIQEDLKRRAGVSIRELQYA